MAPINGCKRPSAAALAGKRRSKLRQSEKEFKEAQFKRTCRERDDYTCRWPECTFRSKTIPVHHINEKSQRPDERYDSDNGACMCWQHHDAMHHTVAGRREGKRLGLLGGKTYELHMKEKRDEQRQEDNSRDREASA